MTYTLATILSAKLDKTEAADRAARAAGTAGPSKFWTEFDRQLAMYGEDGATIKALMEQGRY